MLAFFVKQIYGAKALYNNIMMVFSGEYVPINFMPVGFGSVLMYLPFRFMLFFPIQIALGWIDSEVIWSEFGLGFGWLIMSVILLNFVYKKAVNNFEGEGL
jgi:ABC-2 type transport system permease protein